MIIEKLTQFFTSTTGLIVVSALSIFTALLVLHAWIGKCGKKVKNAEVRTGLVVLLDAVVSFAISALEIFLAADILGATFSWVVVAASAGVGLLVFVLVKEIVGDSFVKELGEAVAAMISKSNDFEGKITRKNISKISQEFLGKIANIDNKKAEVEDKKQTAVVDKAIERLSEIVGDGVVTEAEKAEVEAIVKDNADIINSEFYKKYLSQLNH